VDNSDRHNPNTVDHIVNEIISELPLDDRVRAANLDENGLVKLQLGLGKYLWYLIENQTEIVNEKLMADCIKQSGKETLDEAEAAHYILKQIWRRLRETHRLRVVK
jgi:hypothetical protein